jgi:hypothetical protein
MSFTMAGRRGPTRQEDILMTQDKARKTATRQRMAETGEPYCEARRMTGEAPPGAEDPGEAGFMVPEQVPEQAALSGPPGAPDR